MSNNTAPLPNKTAMQVPAAVNMQPLPLTPLTTEQAQPSSLANRTQPLTLPATTRREAVSFGSAAQNTAKPAPAPNTATNPASLSSSKGSSSSSSSKAPQQPTSNAQPKTATTTDGQLVPAKLLNNVAARNENDPFTLGDENASPFDSAEPSPFDELSNNEVAQPSPEFQKRLAPMDADVDRLPSGKADDEGEVLLAKPKASAEATLSGITTQPFSKEADAVGKMRFTLGSKAGGEMPYARMQSDSSLYRGAILTQQIAHTHRCFEAAAPGSHTITQWAWKGYTIGSELGKIFTLLSGTLGVATTYLNRIGDFDGLVQTFKENPVAGAIKLLPWLLVQLFNVGQMGVSISMKVLRELLSIVTGIIAGALGFAYFVLWKNEYAQMLLHGAGQGLKVLGVIVGGTIGVGLGLGLYLALYLPLRILRTIFCDGLGGGLSAAGRGISRKIGLTGVIEKAEKHDILLMGLLDGSPDARKLALTQAAKIDYVNKAQAHAEKMNTGILGVETAWYNRHLVDIAETCTIGLVNYSKGFQEFKRSKLKDALKVMTPDQISTKVANYRPDLSKENAGNETQVLLCHAARLELARLEARGGSSANLYNLMTKLTRSDDELAAMNLKNELTKGELKLYTKAIEGVENAMAPIRAQIAKKEAAAEKAVAKLQASRDLSGGGMGGLGTDAHLQPTNPSRRGQQPLAATDGTVVIDMNRDVSEPWGRDDDGSNI